MNGISENKFKNVKLNTLQDAAFVRAGVTTFSSRTSSFDEIAPGTILSGTITSKSPNGDAIFTTGEGNFVLNNAKDLKTGDKLSLLLEASQEEIVGKILSINNPELEIINSLKLNIDNNSSGHANYIAHSHGKGITTQPEEIIDLTGNQIVQNDSIVILKTISINSLKLQQAVDKINIILDHDGNRGLSQESENNIEEVSEGFSKYFDKKITGEQSKILLRKLPDIVPSSILEFKVIKIDNNINLTNQNNLIEQPKDKTTDNTTETSLEAKNKPAGLILDNNNKLLVHGKIINQGNRVTIVTEIGVFEVDQTIDRREGDNIHLELINIKDLPIDENNSSTLTNLSNIFKSNFKWDNLEKLLGFNLLNSSEDNIDSEQQIIPTLDKTTLAKLIKFEEAIKNDQIEQLFSTNLNSESITKDPEMLKQIVEDVRSLQLMNKTLALNSPSAWQFMILPIYNQDQLDYIKSFVRSDEKDPTNMRFIIEFNTKTIGNLQFDGFIRFQAKDNKKIDNFNLIVRATSEITPNIREGIMGIFYANQQIQGIKGFIKFEETSQFPINPSQDIISQFLTMNNSFQVPKI